MIPHIGMRKFWIKTDIDLTLSGHTHGMQFGINYKNIKWSPVKFKYPRWAGLYKKNDQKLFVSVGIGFIGFPGRVGIRPEIALITLNRI
jgi:predicted MPP superfamily phosphohydrolase